MIIDTSTRLYLREFVKTDLELLYPLLSDPDVMKYSCKGPYNRKGVQTLIDWCIDSYSARGYGQWAVIDRATGQLIGNCGLSDVKIGGRQTVEIGYRLAKQAWGRGLATEAAATALAYGFDRLKCEQVVAIIACDHTASIRVAEKIGFNTYSEMDYCGWRVRLYHLNHE